MALRVEPSVLKELFGLSLKESSPSILHLTRPLMQLGLQDVLFLAVDVEGSICTATFPSDFEVGIAIMDMRQILALVSKYAQDIDNSQLELDDIVQTYYFCCGHLKYFRKVCAKAVFRNAEHVIAMEIDSKIQTLVAGRDVVLVVHSGENDLRFLDQLNISLRPVYILDTQKAAQNILSLTARASLESLLVTFEIPFVERLLHIGGNDANYTLRSLLMICVQCSAVEEDLNGRQHILLRILERIAKCPLPNKWDENCQMKEGPGRQERAESSRWKRERKAASGLLQEQEQSDLLVKDCKKKNLKIIHN